MGHGRALAIAAAMLLGCAAPEAVDPAGAAIEATPRLVAIGPTAQGPAASDALPAQRVAFRMRDGSIRAVDGEAIAFVPRWRDGAALVDPERRVYEVRPDGRRRMLARGASGALAVSDDGALLAYAIATDVLGELRLHDGARERTLASGLASIGVLRVVEGRVLFVGGRAGGVPGVWSAAMEGTGARCMTNCELVTGTDWQARFVPPPIAASTFELGAGTVAWIDPEGAQREAPIQETP